MGELEYFFEMMATTDRHSDLVSEFEFELKKTEDRKNGVIRMFSEGPGLCHGGDKNTGVDLKLFNLAEIDDIESFKLQMPAFGHLVPDLMYFKKGAFIKDQSGAKYAGLPCLVIEVWSKGNTKIDRLIKKHIYQTSPITEQWYLEQDSNIVECWLGQVRLPDKNLTKILIDHNGYEFDLRHLAINEKMEM